MCPGPQTLVSSVCCVTSRRGFRMSCSSTAHSVGVSRTSAPARLHLTRAARSTTTSPKRWSARGRLRCAPGQRTDAGKQLLGRERLHDVVVRARVERLDLAGGVRSARDDEDRHRRPSADRLDHGDAAETRHAEIEQDEVRQVVRSRLDGFLAIARGHDLVAVRGEDDAQRSAGSAGRRPLRGSSPSAPPPLGRSRRSGVPAPSSARRPGCPPPRASRPSLRRTRATAPAQADAARVGRVGVVLEGLEHACALLLSMPGPWSMTRTCSVVPKVGQ